MAYIDTVAATLAGRILARTTTALWRAGAASMPRDQLEAQVESEIVAKVGDALPSTIEALRHALYSELDHVARRSRMVRIDDTGLSTTPSFPEGGAPGQVRPVAHKSEMHDVLIRLSWAVSQRRKELCRAA